MTMLIKGTDLTAKQRALVFAAFIYRWTSDNTQRLSAWAGIQGKPTVALVTDEEWLVNYAFHFVADGNGLARKTHCEPVYLTV